MDLQPITIDKNSPVPIYHQLQQGLVELIESGQLEPGLCLPSENELARFYKISLMTVRQAMAVLVNDGYIYREQGRGTFVSTRRVRHNLERLTSFSEDIVSRQLTPGSRILLVEKTAPPLEVVKRIELPDDVTMTYIKRIRLVNGNPVGIHHVYLRDVTIAREELEQYQSLYKLLDARGIQIREGEETIEAAAATEEFACLMGVEVGSPLLQTVRFSWDASGKFIEYGRAQYRADLYQYNIRLKR